MCGARVFFCQQRQLFAGPIVRTQVVVAECQKVQGIGRNRFVGVQFYDLFEAVCGGQIRSPPIIEFSHEEMRLCQEVMAFLDLLKRRAVIPASLKIFSHPFKGFEGFLNRVRIALDPLGQPHLALSDSEQRIGGEGVGTVEVEEMGILDHGLRIFLSLEEGLSTLHDDVGVVVLFDRIAQEDLFVRAAQGFLRRILFFGCAGAGGNQTAYCHTEANGRCQSWRSSEYGGRAYHHCVKM